jgi:hypothetical protein
VYIETCRTPRTLSLMGSAGRAALAIAEVDPRPILHTFSPEDDIDDLVANFGPFGIQVVSNESSARIEFAYLHALAPPRIAPIPLPTALPASVEGDVVLRFGCLEGDFVVRANLAVFDPQSPTAPGNFRQNGSSAERLAVVLNAQEACVFAGVSSLDEAAAFLSSSSAAETVVIKDAARGARIYSSAGFESAVPAYQSDTVYKIGSGDVFTGIFAWHWSNGMTSVAAADIASRQTAHYVATGQLPCPAAIPSVKPCQTLEEPLICLLGDPTSLGEHWLLDEADDALRTLGARTDHLKMDIQQALRTFNAVLAVFPVSKAEAAFMAVASEQGLPIAALLREEDRAPPFASKAFTTHDLVTAAYHAMWMAR